MGTLMALGMTQANIIGLFTTEGALHSAFATLPESEAKVEQREESSLPG
jgi:hypothetical protein